MIPLERFQTQSDILGVKNHSLSFSSKRVRCGGAEVGEGRGGVRMALSLSFTHGHCPRNAHPSIRSCASLIGLCHPLQGAPLTKAAHTWTLPPKNTSLRREPTHVLFFVTWKHNHPVGCNYSTVLPARRADSTLGKSGMYQGVEAQIWHWSRIGYRSNRYCWGGSFLPPQRLSQDACEHTLSMRSSPSKG